MARHHFSFAFCAACALALGGCYVSHEGAPGSFRDSRPFPSDTSVDGPFVPDTGTDTFRPPDSGPIDSTVPPDSRVDSTVPPDSGPMDSGRDTRPPRDTGPVDSGRPSRALAFERGDRVFVAPSVTLDITDAHTYELWLRPRTDGVVLHKGTVAPGERYQYLVEVRSGAVIVGWATEESDALVRGPIDMGLWNHVSVVVDADPMVAVVTLYVNGFEAGSATFLNTLFDAINDQPFLMGGFEGDIDEVRLFTFARTASAIRSTMSSRLMPPPPGMEAYWPLEESGQIVLDRTLRGNEGVLGDLTFPDPADPTWITDGAIP